MESAKEIFKKIPSLDFASTREAPLYSEYWSGPDSLRQGGFSPSAKTKNNKYWTNERWWNQSGYWHGWTESLKNVFFNDKKILELCKKSSLVDLGSGKGYAVLSFAIEWDFNKIIGVEINQEYINICRNNIKLIKDALPTQKLTEIVLIHQNAEEFYFNKDVHVVFMFNPFGPKTTQNVCKNIINSLDENPREFYIIYENANHRSIFLETGRFEIIHNVENKKCFVLKSIR